PTYIGGIERGERNVSLLNLVKLSEAFHMTLAELLHFSEPEKDHADKAIQVLIAGQDELALAFYAAFCQKCQSLKRFRELKALAPPPNGPLSSA
ncbi:MAG: helix-turn-helix transcriptional regulator, partial [Nitrospira defluvii]|nr:helix-turn-helix transcriptional regulator [Nitrospira defluvii]